MFEASKPYHTRFTPAVDSPRTMLVWGREIAVGDVLESGGQDRSITRIEQRPDCPWGPARTAYAGDWGVTIESDRRYALCPIHNHLSFGDCYACYLATAATRIYNSQH